LFRFRLACALAWLMTRRDNLRQAPYLGLGLGFGLSLVIALVGLLGVGLWHNAQAATGALQGEAMGFYYRPEAEVYYLAALQQFGATQTSPISFTVHRKLAKAAFDKAVTQGGIERPLTRLASPRRPPSLGDIRQGPPTECGDRDPQEPHLKCQLADASGRLAR
jgi:hypothetical protein